MNLGDAYGAPDSSVNHNRTNREVTRMTTIQALNLFGLILITIGGISAAFFAPTPQYNSDGSVSLSGNLDSKKRISIYRRQQLFPWCLCAVGVGALLQAVALFLPTSP